MHNIFFKSLIFAGSAFLLLSGCRSSQSTIANLPPANRQPGNNIETQSKLLQENPKDATLHYRLALSFLEQQDYVKAEEHIRQAVRLAPPNGVFYEVLGDISFRIKRYSVAINAFKSAIRLQPDLLSAYLRLALVYEKISQNEHAIATLEEGLNRDPQYVEALYHLARLHFVQQEYDPAQEAVEAGLALEPENQEILLLRIRIHSAKGNYYHARILTDRFLEKHPNSYEAWHERLKILLARQEWTTALRMLEKSDHYQKLNDQLIHVQILLRQSKLDEAKTILESLLRSNPLHAQIMVEYATLLIQQGAFQEALTWLERSLEIDRQAQAYFLQASLFFKLRNFLQGDFSLNQAIVLAPLNQSYQLLKLRRKLMQGELEEVEQQLKGLLGKKVLDPEVLRLQSDLLTLQGNYEQAENLIRQIQIIADHDILRFSLGRVYYFQQKYQSVLPITTPLIQKYPSDWESVYLHAATLHRLGRLEEAITVVQPFLQQQKGKGFIHHLVGEFYRYQGDEKTAQETYLAGLEVFPQNVYLIVALSASYLTEQKWEQAYDVILEALEQKHPLQTVLLDRMVYIAYQLDKPQEARRYLQRYNQNIDPILKSSNAGVEKRLLFPVASPLLGYSMWTSPSLPEPIDPTPVLSQ